MLLEGLILPPRTFLLHKKIFSLHSRKGVSVHYGYIFKKGLHVAAE